MEAIICGGRDYTLTVGDAKWLDGLQAQHGITFVIEGGCRRKDYRGDDLPTADLGAKRWAWSRGIPVATVDANWSAHGKAAGPIRNGWMLALLHPGDIVIALPGGRGTADMIEQAEKEGFKVERRK